MNPLKLTRDEEIAINAMTYEDGTYEVRKAHYEKILSANIAAAERLDLAKAERLAAAANAPAPQWASTSPHGLASTSATVTRL